MIEYALRPVGSRTVLVKMIVPEGESVRWSPSPIATPVGRLQWYMRRLGKKRWFRIGKPFSYV